MGKAVLVNDKDNVVTAVSDIKSGEDAVYRVSSGTKQIKASEDIPYGHKIALTEIAKGSAIIKYGEMIGRAKQDIKPGQWIHTHNTDETYAPSR
ncbi:MAG: UxaA family hydrolase [Dehalococcoidales bacterium]|nr:UxaA family hydrolase [Dehalococcoidales bacterium]